MSGRKAVSEWKIDIITLNKEIEELNKKLAELAEKAMDDEKQEEIKKTMNFTGKAIAVMKNEKIAFDLDRALYLFNTQNDLCNCLL